MLAVQVRGAPAADGVDAKNLQQGLRVHLACSVQQVPSSAAWILHLAARQLTCLFGTRGRRKEMVEESEVVSVL